MQMAHSVIALLRFFLASRLTIVSLDSYYFKTHNGYDLQYFKPTIDINKLQYISSASQIIIVVVSLEVSNHFNDLLAGLLVVFKYLIISQRSKHIMHTIL